MPLHIIMAWLLIIKHYPMKTYGGMDELFIASRKYQMAEWAHFIFS
jgi:hypothetical protein